MPGLNDLPKESLAAISKTLMENINAGTAVVDFMEKECSDYDTKPMKKAIGDMVVVLQDVLAAYQKSVIKN